MIFELIPQISLLIFVLVFIGYTAKYFYNVGYYRYAYNPLSQKSLERFLNSLSFGVILILLGILFYALSLGADKSSIPEIMQNISIPNETYEKMLICSYLLSLFIKFVVYILAFSLFIGFLMSYGVAKAVILKTNDSNYPEICVREIFTENDDFLYYITLEGKWGAIRKSSIQSMEEIKADSLFDKWLKKDKNNRYYFIFALITYVIIVVVYRFFR